MNSTNRNTSETGSQGPLGVHPERIADLKAWLDGELAAPAVWFVRAHLWVCPGCREEVKWLKRLGEDMKDLETAVPSPRLRARIMAALPDSPPVPRASAPAPRGGRVRYSFAGAAAACACIALAALALHYSSSGQPERPSVASAEAPPPHSSGTDSSLPARSDHEALATAIPQSTDPYSRMADVMYDRWLQEQESRQSTVLAQNRSNWSRFVSTLRSVVTARHTGDPVKLALAVPDVGNAESELTSWAKSVGGSVSAQSVAGASTQTVAPFVTTEEAPAVPGGRDSAGAHVVMLHVSAVRVAYLEPVLRHLGAWDSRQSPASVPAIHVAAVHPSQSVSGTQRTVTKIDPTIEPGGQTTSPAALRAGPPDQSAARDPGEPQVTLQIRLTSLQSPVP